MIFNLGLMLFCIIMLIGYVISHVMIIKYTERVYGEIAKLKDEEINMALVDRHNKFSMLSKWWPAIYLIITIFIFQML